MPYINNNQRNLFIKTIKEQLIGPGSDIFGFDPEKELISSSPLSNYYAGILFPPAFLKIEKSQSASESGKEEGDNDIQVTDEQETNQDYSEIEDKSDSNDGSGIPPSNIYSSTYPTHCGLVFCIDSDIRKLSMEVSYGKYAQAETRQIRLTREEYSLIMSKIREIEKDEELTGMFGNDYLSSRIEYSDRILKLNSPLPVHNYTENGEVKHKTLLHSDFKKKITSIFDNYQLELQKLLRLLGNIYERKSFKHEMEIELSNMTGFIVDNELEYLIKEIHLTNDNRKKIVRIQIRNVIDSKRSYKDCLFQIKLRINDIDLLPYHEPFISSVDEDYSEIEYQYQDERIFGKGCNCAVAWENSENPTWIETTHLPESDIRSFSNDAKKDDPNSEVLKLHNLSVWSGWDKEEYISNLFRFVASYRNWINNKQHELINLDTPEKKPVGLALIKKQRETCARLIANVNYLRKHEKALSCFKMANTAMLLQMVVARDIEFKKDRTLDEVHASAFTEFRNIEFFRRYAKNKPDIQPRYRPFQLAFLLMNVEAVFNNESPDRRNIVDLIWFPTGGGKTEAYLALTALTIIKRRMDDPDDCTTSVLMRYTLRLLTSQQFERATYLICALEFLRKNHESSGLRLGNKKINIGMWVGNAATPNKLDELWKGYFSDFFDKPTEERNRFPITYCPWCGTKLTREDKTSDYGYVRTEHPRDLILICQNEHCFFHGQDENILPVAFIDEKLYDSPPTLLFATVDKLVQLSHKDAAGNFFDSQTPPDLIIQDELHLLTGPLGSLSGLYETLIDILCTSGDVGIMPKIVASTATARNSGHIIKQMYGRNLNVFPPQGVRYNDNYFTYQEETSRRKHIGLIPAGKPSVTTEIKLVETIYLAKAMLLKEFAETFELNKTGEVKKYVDPYWSLVLYYNSLRDLGRSNSRVTQEFKERIRGKFTSFGLNKEFEFIHANIFSRTVEFTSRQDSTRIKALLSRVAKQVKFNETDDKGKWMEDNDCIDLALASNMFSVGIDVDRLNLMLVMGQPGSVSEYIQATSRIARKSKGLVINLFSNARTREMSFYENFTGFHNSYYKYVEPFSITPFTEVAADKLLNAVLVGYVRQKLRKQHPEGFVKSDADSLFSLIESRIPDEYQKNYIQSKLDKLADAWVNLIHNGHARSYQELFKNPSFDLMNSLRDIDPDVFIKNHNLDYTPNY